MFWSWVFFFFFAFLIRFRTPIELAIDFILHDFEMAGSVTTPDSPSLFDIDF